MKEVNFVGSSNKDLRAFPEAVRREVGFAIYQAQRGGKAINALPLVGFGDAGIVEVISNYDGDTFRAVYAVRFRRAVYVLHAFKKKSHTGIATPKTEIRRIKARLRAAEEHYKETYLGQPSRVSLRNRG